MADLLAQKTITVAYADSYTFGPEEGLPAELKDLNRTDSGTAVIEGYSSDALCVLAHVDGNSGEEGYFEYFTDNTVYSNRYGEYKSPIHQEIYVEERLIPLDIVTPEYYDSITVEREDGDYIIHFTEPNKLESWHYEEEEGASEISEGLRPMLDCHATVRVSEDGKIISAEYIMELDTGALWERGVYRYTVEDVSKGIETTPSGLETYAETSAIDAPSAYMLKNAKENLLAADQLHAECNKSFAANFNGDSYYLTQIVDISDDESGYTFGADMNTTYSNTSADTENYRYTEKYQNAVYHFSDSEGEHRQEVYEPEVMQDYAERILTEFYPVSDAVTDLKTTDEEDSWCFSYNYMEPYQDMLASRVIEELGYDLQELLPEGTKAKTTACRGSLYITKDSCLPTALYLSYSATVPYGGYEYVIAFEAVFSFTAPCADAFYNATGAVGEEPEPETPATPLFYHVTGDQGKELWLLGTIHLGDARTAYLPDEIYAAFDAADALAVEYDQLADEKRLEEDPAYAQEIGSHFIYADGTTLSDHVSKQAYKDAVAELKKYGYSAAFDYYNPAFLGSYLSNKQIAFSSGLSSQKGVDRRLLHRAYAQEKEILSIESAQYQIEKMYTGSDAFLEFLLKGQLTSRRGDMLIGTYRLYELWCAGDEQKMTQYLNLQNMIQVSEEEKALQAEYTDRLETERNKNMLKAAKEYLEGDTTVFYAVGLAHVIADDGLVKGLRDAGYTVEAVSFS